MENQISVNCLRSVIHSLEDRYILIRDDWLVFVHCSRCSWWACVLEYHQREVLLHLQAEEVERDVSPTENAMELYLGTKGEKYIIWANNFIWWPHLLSLMQSTTYPCRICSNAHKPFNMLRKHCCSLMHSLYESSDWRAEPKGRELTMQLATHKQCSEWSFPIINSCCAVVERLTIVTLMLKNRPFLIYLFFPSKNYSEHQERSLFSKYKPGHFITIPHNLKFETIDNLSVKLNDY